MGKIRVMFIGQGPSGLAEDRVVNTFHFWDAGARDPGDLAACSLAVTKFYGATVGAGGTQTLSVGSYLSPWVSRTAELRAYDLEEPGAGHVGEPKRTPYITPLLLNAAGSPAGLPEEVACVITVHAAAPVGPRRRGRIYIGPLIDGAITLADSSTASRPSLSMTSNLRIAAMSLIGQTDTPLNWSIRSTLPTENFNPIVSGYIDNAVDIQRRRGPDPSFRTTFAGPV